MLLYLTHQGKLTESAIDKEMVTDLLAKCCFQHYLVHMGAHHKYGGFGCMHRDGAQPEVEACVLVPQTDVPQQQVHGTVGQEELASKIM